MHSVSANLQSVMTETGFYRVCKPSLNMYLVVSAEVRKLASSCLLTIRKAFILAILSFAPS